MRKFIYFCPVFLFAFLGIVSEVSAKPAVFQELTITFNCPIGFRIAGTITALTENGTVIESIGIDRSFEKKIKASAVSINFHSIADEEWLSVMPKQQAGGKYRPLLVGLYDLSEDYSVGVQISDKNGRILKKAESVLIPSRYLADTSLISFTHRQEVSLSYKYLGNYKKVLKTAKLTPNAETKKEAATSEQVTQGAENLDLNAINGTNSAGADARFVGKYYRVIGTVDQVMGPSDGTNAFVTIQPNVMAKGMGSTAPLEINIWLTPDEFNKIGGTSSQGKQIDVSVKLKSIDRNATSKDPAVKGYPVQLEFGESETKQ